MTEILKAIRDFLCGTPAGPIYKSDLREIGIDPRTAERFFRLIRFCQEEMPRIQIAERDGRFVVTSQ